MPVQRTVLIDFDTEDLCRFLRDDSHASQVIPELPSEFDSADFERQKGAVRIISGFECHRPVGLLRQVICRSPTNRPIRVVPITDYEIHKIMVELEASLFIRQSAMAFAPQILDTFSNTPLDASFDLGVIEDLLAGQGIPSSAYYVALSTRLVKVGQPAISTEQLDRYIRSLQDLDGMIGQEPFRVEIREPTKICVSPSSLPKSPVVFEYPEGGNPPSDLEIIATTEPGQCDNPRLFKTHAGRNQDKHFQHSFITVMKEIRIGRCTLVKTKVWVFAQRTAWEDIMLWAKTEGGVSNALQPAIEKALLSAAGQLNTVQNIKSNIGWDATAADFKRVATDRLLQLFPDYPPCLDAGFSLEWQCTDWEEVF